MKTLLFVMGSLLSLGLSAQIYHPFQTSLTNPNWSQAFWIGPGFTPNFSWYEINNDTVIGAQTYGKVEHFYGGTPIYEGALRDNGLMQVVFIPKDSVSEMLIYDFSKGLSDTLFNIWCYDFNTWQEDTLVVTSHDSVLLNGNYYDHFYLQNLEGFSPMPWIESIGSEGDLLRHVTYPSVSGGNYLTCFHNNAGTIYTTNQAMGWTGSTTCYLGEEEEVMHWIKVYPNPASEFILIDHSELTNNEPYQILNMHGQVVQSGNIGTGLISLEELNHGIYILRIANNKSWYLSRFTK